MFENKRFSCILLLDMIECIYEDYLHKIKWNAYPPEG